MNKKKFVKKEKKNCLKKKKRKKNNLKKKKNKENKN